MKKIYLSFLFLIVCNYSFSQIVANDDHIQDCFFGGIYQVFVLDNDNLNGNPVSIDNPVTGTIGNVTLSILGNYPTSFITINSDGSLSIDLTGYSSCGLYLDLEYKICDKQNPTICDIGLITFTSLNALYVVSDDFTNNPINTLTGGTTSASVVDNDYFYCTYLDGPTQLSVIPGITMDSEGYIHVAPNTTPGNYIIDYSVTDLICNYWGQANAEILVVSNNGFYTNPDIYQTLCANQSINVLNNDYFNYNPIDTSLFTVTAVELPTGVTLSNTGIATLPSTMTEGIHYIKYQVCSNIDPTVCSVNYARFYFMKNKIVGKIKYEASGNCLSTTPNLSNIKVKNTTNFGDFYTYSNSAYSSVDNYLIKGETSSNSLTLPDIPSYFNVTASPTNTTNMTLPCETQNIDFCISANASVNDLEILFLPTTVARPGFESKYVAIIKNVGSTTLSGSVTISFDNAKMSYISSGGTLSGSTPNSLTYNFNNLNPFSESLIHNIKFQIFTPPTVNQNDILTINAVLSNVVSDNTPSNNSYTLNQQVVNSYDPNDITVFEGETVLYDEINNYLHYKIRFQNTGSASAVNVYLQNQIDSKLDINKLQILSSSHQNLLIVKDNMAEFLFNDIYLPSNVTNEELSNGYVIYRIKPKTNVNVGDVFNNVANIYFDYNAPITTNTATTEILNTLSNEDFQISNLFVLPNPSKDFIKLNTNQNINYDLFSLTGQKVKSGLLKPDENIIDIKELEFGFYILELNDNYGRKKVLKVLKE